jgi:hypothetical protein
MVSILNCYDNSADVIIEKYESEFYNSLLQSKKMKNELGLLLYFFFLTENIFY